MSESIHKSERKPQAIHFCCVCLRDITGMRRVKDPKGRYFCKRCYKVGQLRKYQLAKRKLAAAPLICSAADLRLTVPTLDPTLITMQTPAPVLPAPPLPNPLFATDTTPLLTPSPVPAPAPAPTIIAASALAPLPEPPPSSPRCPLCNEPLPPNQRVCNDCAAELPSLNNLLDVRDEHATRIHRQQHRLKSLKTAALVAIPLAIASLGLIAFGHWHTPSTAAPVSAAPSRDYPTTRAGAVEEILSSIQDGSDASYENALHLVAARTGQPANITRDDAYRSAFKLMHDDFRQKYGPDWLPLAHVENLFPNDDTQFVPFSITIHNDVYHVTSQALTPPDAQPTAPNPLIHFPENGTQRFAIVQIEEYAVIRDSTVERRDPLKLTDPAVPADFKSQANNFPPATPPLSP